MEGGGWRLAVPLAMKSRLGSSDMSLVDLDPCTMMGEARQGFICSIVSQHTDCIFVEDPKRYTPYLPLVMVAFCLSTRLSPFDNNQGPPSVWILLPAFPA
jgi:hypothetical protein